MKTHNLLIIVFVLLASLAILGCESRTNTMITAYAADGLDLKAVGEILKESKDAQDLEEKLNKPGGVNNLDLDEDDKVDFIKVTSDDQENIRVMKLTAVLSSNGDQQDVATIEVENADETADVQIHGNEQIYGHNHYHHSRFGFTDALILYWLFRPRYTPYSSPWGYGNYPGYYGGGYASEPMTTYRNRTGNMTRGTTYASSSSNRLSKQVKSTTTNSSSRIKAPLKNPTSSQRSFQARNPSKQVRSTGFGRRGTTTRSSRATRSRSVRTGK
jgi:hypothetical protein